MAQEPTPRTPQLRACAEISPQVADVDAGEAALETGPRTPLPLAPRVAEALITPWLETLACVLPSAQRIAADMVPTPGDEASMIFSRQAVHVADG